jgi:adenylate cyclase
MAQSRQLAVIMFTDIMGYTAMMQQDEAFALNKLNRFKDQLTLQVKEFRGEIIQYYGDGCLLIFTNSADAVNCARVLQEDFREEPQVPVRIGIHLGDILINEGNIFGDCVNITSRIESMGVAGSVLLSEPIKKQIQNKQGFQLISLGNFEFKNVTEPMEIFALANNGFPIPDHEAANGKFKEVKTAKSIAVLPFVNMSNDSGQEYFSDGIAEEIINSLTHLKDLKVAGRTSSFQFKGKNIDLREVGEKLSVRTVLEGGVRKQGNRLRITVQLINVEDGYHLWSERYDREIDDVFAIQDDIALAITEKLKLTLLKKDRDLITKTYTQNTEAYELYLKARFYLSRRGTSIITSMEYFQKAIDLDPDFALAYAAYSDANLLIATYGLAAPKQVMIRAKQLAEKAIQLDPSLSEPYCALGYYYACYEWNWQEARKNFIRSIELNPQYAEAHYRYGWNYLACVEGKFDEAEKHGKIAIKLEPLSSICYGNYSLILSSAGKFNEAIAACKTGIELDANSFVCHLNAGNVYTVIQQYENAISSYESAMKLSNRHHFIVNAFILNYCLTGNFDKAGILMNELKEKSQREYVAHAFTALSATFLAGPDKAFEYLEKAYDDHDPILLMIKYLPSVPPALKEDPRFQRFLNKIGFPQDIPTRYQGL